jgi:hypothetical protein
MVRDQVHMRRKQALLDRASAMKAAPQEVNWMLVRHGHKGEVGVPSVDGLSISRKTFASS